MVPLAEVHPDLVVEQVARHRTFFNSGATRTVEARQQMLRQLKKALEASQDAILDGIHQDFRKPRYESFFEVSTVMDEIDLAIRMLPTWVRSRPVSMGLMYKPASASRVPEPFGVALVISPWNYPVNLSLIPLVNAVAAGNTVILKPSEFSPNTNRVLSGMFAKYLSSDWVSILEGGPELSQTLIEYPVDYVFFTGSPRVGKMVMASAAKNLVPVTLELGGKSPVILDEKVSVEAAAQRIMWGKTFNGGQTCIAGDYLLLPHNRKEEFIQAAKKVVHDMLGSQPQQSPDFSRIITHKHWERLSKLITGKVVVGGQTEEADLYIAPTVIDVEDPATHPAMQEEIFGPILPVIGYHTIDEAIAFINARPKPLALYLFSNSRSIQQRFEQETSSGAMTVNDLIMQAALSDLPFGGVGNSGMGSYHGERGFETFSHFKSVLKRSLLFDIPFRYPPYKVSVSLTKSLMKWFG